MKKKIILIIISILSFSGCYNYNELNTLAISTAMSIDYKDGDYIVSILIANSKKSQASAVEGESQSVVYEGKGKSISEAIKEIDKLSPKQIYIGHLSVIIVSEDLAKNGLYNSLDYLLRNPESIKRFYLIVAKDTDAKSILEIISPLESFPSQGITVNISYSKESKAITSAMPYSTFIEELLETGNNPSLPTIEIKGDAEEGKSEESLKESTPAANLVLSNIALFKDDRLVNITSEDESMGINIIKNEVTELLINNECDDGIVATKLTQLKTKIKTQIKDGKPKYTIEVKTNAGIEEITCKTNLEDNKEIEKIEKQIEEKIEELIKEGIEVAQQYGTDIFGFGNKIYKHYPKYYEQIKDNWDEETFPHIDYNIKVKVTLNTKGSIESSLKEPRDEK